MRYTSTHLLPSASGSTSSQTDGSRTLTITSDPIPEHNGDDQRQVVGTLKLRGAHTKKTQRISTVAWSEEVVDNEGCGRKKSKSTPFIHLTPESICLIVVPVVCCVYHKPRRFDESSDESDSDSDVSDYGYAGHGHDCRGSSAAAAAFRSASGSTAGVVNTFKDRESNAYESAPSHPKHS
jgi:protein phosphatase 1 regulatory subunit 11